MPSINDMTVGSPTRDIIKFSLPLVGGYILQQMYLLIDAAIVGRFIGVDALAAVGASSSVMFLVLGFCNGACAGFAIPVAQEFGAKNYSKMRAYVANAVRIVAVIAVVATAVTAVLCDRILEMLNTPGDVFHDAYTFLLINFLAIPFTMSYDMLSGFIRALGDSKQPFYFLIAASLLNIALDFALIMGMGLGVEGAGLATMASQAFASALCFTYIKKRMKMLIPTGHERAYNDKMTGKLLMNGVPMGMQFSITAIGVIMLQSANNALGTMYVAAFTAAARAKYIFTCVYENIGVAMATYCGQNIGAKKIDRVKLGIVSAMKITVVFFLATTVIIYFFADEMMLLFIDAEKTDIISIAAQYMLIPSYFFLALGTLTVLRYSLQGLGYSNLSVLSGVMELIARCGVSLWVVPTFGFLGVCYGDPLAFVAADIILIPAVYFVYKRLKKLRAKN